MSEFEAFTGLRVGDGDARVRQWAAALVRTVFAVLVIGVVLAVILWPSVSADAGALTLSIVFAACTGLMILRQALLAERVQRRA